MPKRVASDLVPLKPNWFQILLSVVEGERHGYAIMQEVAERTDGKVRLWPATLYGTIRKLEEAQLIEPVQADPGDEDDERRQYYGITPFGREVLDAEVQRLDGLVRLARARGAGAFQ